MKVFEKFSKFCEEIGGIPELGEDFVECTLPEVDLNVTVGFEGAKKPKSVDLYTATAIFPFKTKKDIVVNVEGKKANISMSMWMSLDSAIELKNVSKIVLKKEEERWVIDIE